MMDGHAGYEISAPSLNQALVSLVYLQKGRMAIPHGCIGLIQSSSLLVVQAYLRCFRTSRTTYIGRAMGHLGSRICVLPGLHARLASCSQFAAKNFLQSS